MDEIKPVAGKDYPATWSEFRDWFASDDVCAAYLEQLRWPNGFYCPTCGIAGYTGSCYERSADLPSLPTSVQCDGWNDLRQDPHPASRLVRSRVVPHQPEARGQCPGTATRAGSEQLSDRLGHAAPVSACDGAPRPGLAERDGGDRRDVPGAATRSPRGRQRCALQDTQQSSLGCRRGGG